MKVARLLLFFIIALVITTAGLSFLQPTSQRVERSIEINAAPEIIYNKLAKLENFHSFSIWSREDSSYVFTIHGTDGMPGSSTTWKGHPEISGEGKITIKTLEPRSRVVHEIEVYNPKKAKALSEFKLLQTSSDRTTVTWTFNLATPRPWNIFNLFYSLDKEKGKDFEDGLKTLKLLVETGK